jgi:hypothetical protein
VRNVRDALFRNITGQELQYVDATSTGVLISRISQDVVYVLDTYVNKLKSCVQFCNADDYRARDVVLSDVASDTDRTGGVANVRRNPGDRGGQDQQSVGGIPRHINGDCCASGGVVTNCRTDKLFDNELYESEKKGICSHNS